MEMMVVLALALRLDISVEAVAVLAQLVMPHLVEAQAVLAV
tara:strand:- start:227 stop:349 length:123 start_codon:yes stop_codon:yes gene_type:complete